MSDAEFERRLKIAREAAAYAAWCDFMSAFTIVQRYHVSSLLAHRWRVTAIILESESGQTHLIEASPKEKAPGV